MSHHHALHVVVWLLLYMCLWQGWRWRGRVDGVRDM